MKKIIRKIIKSNTGRSFIKALFESYLKQLVNESIKNGNNIPFMIVMNSIDKDKIFDQFIDNL